MIRFFRRSQPPHFSWVSSPESSASTEEGVVRVTLPALIALHHAAASLSLKPGRRHAPGSGDYHSPFKGRGMEFDEVRAYAQGDDVRTLDWRVTARTGRAHTKLFREERERAVLLWVDLRCAMFFATRGAYKAVRAAQAAALLGWSAVHQGDRLGGLIFSEKAHIELRPKRGKPPLLHLLQQLVAHPAWLNHVNDPLASEQALHKALIRLRSVTQPGSLIILLSDFADLNEQDSAQLAQLARHNELVLVDIHDTLEQALPPPGQYRLSDGENFMTLSTENPHLREHYHSRFARQQEALQLLCRRHKMTLLPLDTHDDPLRALQKVLGVQR